MGSVFGNNEQYLSILEKAAHLAYASTTNHAFIDGNQRIGVLTMLMTLKLNRITLVCMQADMVAPGLAIADASLGYDDIYQRVMAHMA